MQPPLADKENRDTYTGIFQIGGVRRQRTSPAVHRNPAATDCLDSWKEIAAHLKRTVRTVQRWEKQEGLPVYRHPHNRSSSVYASKSELDAWWKRGSVWMEKEASCVRGESLDREATKSYLSSMVRPKTVSRSPSAPALGSNHGSRHSYLPELAAIEISVVDEAAYRTLVLRVRISIGDRPPRARIETATKRDNTPSRLLSLAKNVLTN